MKQALPLIGISLLSVASSLAADKTPNIILILADDMRASGMNFLGKEQVQTDSLDRAHLISTHTDGEHAIPAMVCVGGRWQRTGKESRNVIRFHV